MGFPWLPLLFCALVTECLTEVLVSPISIINRKIIEPLRGLCQSDGTLAEFLHCGYCMSFWVSLGVCWYWFDTLRWSEFAFGVAVVWRLANMLHTCYSYLQRKKLFVGAAVVG